MDMNMNMKRILHILSVAVLAVFALTSCVDDELVKSGEVVEGVPITVTFNIGGIPTTDVTVNTRADDNSLSDLNNLVIFVFRQDGSLEHYVSSRPNKDITFTKQSDGLYKVSFKTTSGTKNLIAVANTSQNTADGGFWELTEIQDAVTSGELNFDVLKTILINLKGQKGMQPIQIVSASQMMMAGWNTGVTFNTDGTVSSYGTDGDSSNSNNVIVKMDRTMARITFNIKEGSFVPNSYRVYNIPTKSYLTNKDKSKSDGIEELSYIYTASSNIGTASNGQYSFEFYLPENIQNEAEDLKATPSDDNKHLYAKRDLWTVEDGKDGSLPENKTWTYAGNGTFVVINGTYTGNADIVDEKGDKIAEDHTVTGNAEYTIHLGDFSSTGSYGNFSVERNVSYTYNVTVTGVNNIVVEALTNKENQPGAEGDIYDYDDVNYSYQLDAHYEQVYLAYNLTSIAENLDQTIINDPQLGLDAAIADRLVLVIQSPMMDEAHPETANEPYQIKNNRGIIKPYQIYVDNNNDTEAAKKEALKYFDYKWVELLPQQYAATPTLGQYPGVSSWSRATGIDKSVYGGETGDNTNLIDVYDAIVAMGKVIKKIKNSETGTINTRDFAEEGITVNKVGDDYYACFTAFVNEYFYYNHPLTDEEISWDKFTNTIPREMMITMDSKFSSDGNSSYSKLYSYISQLSMQTFYNAESGLNGFGIETYNETPLYTWGGGAGSSPSDGRSNQLSLIGIDDYYSPQWSTFINFSYNGWTQSNMSSHKLEDDAYQQPHRYAYAACMSRNRDLNNNSKIDENEVRWYLPSLNEYIRISIGSDAISGAARLYTGDKNDMVKGSEGSPYPTSYIDKGSLYYTSSNGNQRVYWAVERGSYGTENSWTGYNGKQIRCIRVLPGNDLTNLSDFTTDATYEWDNTKRVLKFKGRMNPSLYRERVSNRLRAHTEDDAANRFYDGIYVAKNDVANVSLGQIIRIGTVQNGNSYETYSDDNPCADYHEDGDNGATWRVPNLVEFSAMKAESGISLGGSVACGTQFSNQDIRFGFITAWYNSEIYIMATGGGVDETLESRYKVRCVRDVEANYFSD